MHKHEKTVLINGGDPETEHRLSDSVRSLGHRVQLAKDQEEVLACLRNSEMQISALVLGDSLPNEDSMDTLLQVRRTKSNLPVIMVADLWATREVLAALRNGATDILCKPLIHEELVGLLTGALENVDSRRKTANRRDGPQPGFQSANRQIREIESLVEQVGWSGAPVLIHGETGSGKEVLARKLHANSSRANKQFLKLNCAALPPELVESELFGYEKGAFTGAFERKAGIFELADGGTILLDEIGDMDIRLQAKLLQVLQDQEFRRIGGKETVKVNVRIMAATHRDLEHAIHDRTFREDLYYRLSVVVLQVPPLRERTEDIIGLGEYFLRKHSDSDSPVPLINPGLRHALLTYNWPGNVRELENHMRKLVIFRDPDALAHEIQTRMGRKGPASSRTAGHSLRLEKRIEIPVLEQVTKDKRQAETEAILAALESTRWNRKQAAAILKTEYKSLLYKMKKLGIDDDPTSSPEASLPIVRAASGG